jgi:hypothetical protein
MKDKTRRSRLLTRLSVLEQRHSYRLHGSHRLEVAVGLDLLGSRVDLRFCGRTPPHETDLSPRGKRGNSYRRRVSVVCERRSVVSSEE